MMASPLLLMRRNGEPALCASVCVHPCAHQRTAWRDWRAIERDLPLIALKCGLVQGSLRCPCAPAVSRPSSTSSQNSGTSTFNSACE
jgi:hypothetical protein